jgi:hypothetical protein
MFPKEKTFEDCWLVALRIPANWVVKHNAFLDEPPLDANGNPNKFHCDSPDLLLMRQVRTVVNNKLSTEDKDLLLLDASWKYLPIGTTQKSRANGCYWLKLYRGNFSEGTMLLHEVHNSIEEIVSAINRILKECSYGKWDV